jgi:RNA polymerase sigma-70 factor, ECF subfamily
MLDMPFPDRTSEFVSLLATHDRGVYKYILTLLADPLATQEVYQETSLTLWQKFDDFRPGSNFLAWACRVAYFEVLKSRKRARRDRLRFGDDLLHTLAEELSAGEEVLQARRGALPDCMERLSPGDRELVEQRYAGQETILEIAERTGRSVNTLYKALERIRRVLMKCIEERVTSVDPALERKPRPPVAPKKGNQP